MFIKDGAGTLISSNMLSRGYKGAFTVNDGTLNFTNDHYGVKALTINKGTVNLNSSRVNTIMNAAITVGSASGDAANLNLMKNMNLNAGSSAAWDPDTGTPLSVFTLYKNGTVTLSADQSIAGNGEFKFIGGGTVTGKGKWISALQKVIVEGANAEAFVETPLSFYSGKYKKEKHSIDVQDASSVLTISGNITNGTESSITKKGAGKLVLSGTSLNYTGDTNVNAGILVLSNAANTMEYTSGILVADGATLQLDSTATIAAPISVAGRGLNAAGAVQFTGSASLDGNVTLVEDSVFSVTADKTATISGLLLGADKTLTKVGAGVLVLKPAENGSEKLSYNIMDGLLQFDNALDAGQIGLGNGSLALNNSSALTADVLSFLNANGSVFVDMTGLEAGKTLFSAENGMSVFTDAASAVQLSDAMRTFFLPGVQTGNEMVFRVNSAAVPEPTAWALLALGFFGMFWLRKR